MEQVVNDPDNRNNPMIQEEKKLFDGGKLLTPSFVLKVTREKTIDVSKAGFSIVFSGSPRTMFEAFGDDKNRGLVDILDEQYGKENALFVLLDIDPGVATYSATRTGGYARFAPLPSCTTMSTSIKLARFAAVSCAPGR
ncbi:MAG: hypothetical protein UY02_C0013G0014 [Candidatus Giovannonibacteria bacterium GW2011_GWB1_47_6b]|uniref:Uncharacterized protein n=1 Tax=Candidatus Giovannonibacteria bacterium GW2011_GWB1_47_6b TaxID=1618655 RepID=A0A0G1VF40_9BACT|nr:MAG: hypothetical protein UY02_C0013G0014 [Candidatus Giovannonibacteria bacterium GW2011_GWB1_47_6b]